MTCCAAIYALLSTTRLRPSAINSNRLPICHADYEAPRPVNETAVVKDPDFAIRSVAMQLYYAQLAYLAKTNRTHYISDITQLAQYAPLGPAALNGTCR